VSVTEISTEAGEKKKEKSKEKLDEDEADDDDVEVKTPDSKSSSNDRSPIAAFLPSHSLLWSWSDQGWRQSSKSRRVFHKTIQKGSSESLSVGDCAVFLSTSRPDRPYIGRIHSMVQTTGGNMKVQVRWFYHPAEVEGSAKGGGRVDDLQVRSNALFASTHADENDVQTISHKCTLLQYNEYKKRIDNDGDDLEDVYYLAGDYDPVVGTIQFCPGVIS